MDFLIGGTSAVCAGFFTNPLEVIKIRMQLQGELEAKGKHSVHYKNLFHGAYVVAKHDGLLALQAGLVPGLWFQLLFNGIRLGTYQTMNDSGFTKDKQGNIIFHRTIFLGGICGALGALVSSPFFLLKTQLQSQAAKEIAFGHQHNHNGTIKGFINIYKSHGFKGLYRGCTASIPRTFIGSMAQLTTFTYCKDLLKNYHYLNDYPMTKTFLASMMGGIFTALAVTPFDLIATRLYNQGVDANGNGLLYKGYNDCVVKILKSEGFLGFYKGLMPSYLRLGPHTVLTLMFWDQIKEIYLQYLLLDPH